MTRRIRLIAWSVIFAFAVFQAYAQRYVVGPDGISYLDISDAVVTGEWSRLLNVYWSPLYPFLVGVARRLGGVGPGGEVPVMHAVNLVAFAGMSWAFEYLLVSILALAARTRGSALRGPWGLAGVYALFAIFALTMIPLELTTPDLLCAAAVFTAFGALLRLREGSPHPVRDAAVLGTALGLGALAKSFLVPWAVVCLVVAAIGARRNGSRTARTVSIAVAIWAAFVVPWTALLSHAAGRVTAGDAGRLTYAWYVNEQNPPSRGGIPAGARSPGTDSILAGVGVPGDAPGTDPVWYDPARWNRGVVPRLNANDQLRTLRVFVLFYIQNLTPLLFLVLLVVAAPGGTRGGAWKHGWVVYLPAAAGVLAYALVIVTARYIMPFVLAGTLTLLAVLPLPRRLVPARAAAALLVPVAIEALSPRTLLGLALVVSVLGGLAAGVFVPARSKIPWTFAVVAALGATRALLGPNEPWLLRGGALAMVALIFIAARASIREWRPLAFARRFHAALGVTLGLVLGLRLALRLDQDARQLNESNRPRFGNVSLSIARELEHHGIAPGTRIAVIGPHAEAYWARTARLHIAASVPRTLTTEFWRLPAQERDVLLERFAAAGATVAIATVGPADGQPDSTWTPVLFQGWIRTLKR